MPAAAWTEQDGTFVNCEGRPQRAYRAVSPPGGDFAEPVTSHTKRYVRCFWALDRQRAQARFYPAIHPLQSYSADSDALASWWKVNGNPDWLAQRQRVTPRKSLEVEQARAQRRPLSPGQRRIDRDAHRRSPVMAQAVD